MIKKLIAIFIIFNYIFFLNIFHILYIIFKKKLVFKHQNDKKYLYTYMSDKI